MTDEPTPEATDEQAAAPASGRGRPRPQATIDRDNSVLAWLREQKDEAGKFLGKTRDEIAKGLGIEGKQVYLSIFRLNRDGKVAKGVGSAHAWAAKSDDTTEAPAEATPETPAV